MPDEPTSLQRLAIDFSAFKDLDKQPDWAVRLFEFLSFFAENVKRQGPYAYADRVLEAIGIEPGQSVLDAGCGPYPRDLVDFALAAGKEGRLAACDKSTQFVEIARKVVGSWGLQADITVADVNELPYTDSSFDRIYSERVLQYVGDPLSAMHEFARVLKPGGRLVVVDSDWDTVQLNHPDKQLTRELIQALADLAFADGQIGRRLRALSATVGLRECRIGTLSITYDREMAERVLIEPIRSIAKSRAIVDESRLNDWFEKLDEVTRAGGFFAALSGVMLVAEKPVPSGP